MMRGERATLGKSLLDVQRDLKIKATYIAAVENADPSVFETPGFIAGYVRSYARYLGMDPDWAYQRFCAESGFQGVDGMAKGTIGAKPQPKSESRIGKDDPVLGSMTSFTPVSESIFSRIEPGAIGSVAVLIGLISALGYGGFSVLQEIQRVQFAPVDQTPGITSQVTDFAGASGMSDPTLLATNATENVTQPSADALDRLYRPQALKAPILTARDGPIATLDPRSTGALVDAVPEVVINTVSADPRVSRTVVATASPSRVQVVEPQGPELAIFAVRPAWVRVASSDGTILFEKILDAGEQYILPQTDTAPILRAGNSGSLYFNVQGKAYGPAGSGTTVTKNVSLAADAITENYAQADLTADPELSDVLTAMAEASVLGAETETETETQQ
nr:RodZ domain-containing protein [Litoreibacter roseus]